MYKPDRLWWFACGLLVLYVIFCNQAFASFAPSTSSGGGGTTTGGDLMRPLLDRPYYPRLGHLGGSAPIEFGGGQGTAAGVGAGALGGTDWGVGALGRLGGAIGAAVWPSSLASCDSSGHCSDMRIPLVDDPSKRFPIPRPPATKVGEGSYGWRTTAPTCTTDSRVGFDTPREALEDFVSYINGLSCANGNGVYKYEVCSDTQIRVVNSACYVPNDLIVEHKKTCGSGYALKGETCKLVDPLRVPDRNCDVGRGGGKFIHIGDIDCEAASFPGTLLPDGSILYSGKDANGNPIYWNAKPSADGGTDLGSRRQLTDGKGDSYVQDSTAHVGPDGYVTQGAQSTSPGSLTNTGGIQPGSSNQTDPSSNPFPDGSTGPGTGSQPFPDDYAREPTLQKELRESEAIRKNSDDFMRMWQDFIGQSTPPPDPTIDEGKDKYADPFKDVLQPLKNFSVGQRAGQCPVLDISFTMFSQYFDLRTDAHCTLFDEFLPLIGAACLAIYAIAALYIVLSA